MSRKRALILCPGRGTYTRDCLGSLSDSTAAGVDIFDQLRIGQGLPGVRALDAMPRYSSAHHIAGEHASALTAAVTLHDLEQVDEARVDIVGICGNSMGWYTALGVGGALPMADCALLIETMGARQAGHLIGGQLVYPMVDPDTWRLDPTARDAVHSLVAQTPDLFWSIHLGGQAVLGGSAAALKTALAQLPPRQLGTHRFPLRLPLHSAFHTPLMADTARQAAVELADLGWHAPRVPLFDGRGHCWRPLHASPAAIRDYTLGHQIIRPFHFNDMLRAALGATAPDLIILPGPGSNLGGAIAQQLIAIGWQNLRSKDDFIARQRTDPLLISMRWPDQRSHVVSG